MEEDNNNIIVVEAVDEEDEDIFDEENIHIRNFLRILPNMVYFNTIFTVVFGSSIIILAISLFTDLNPSIIPFEVVPINFGKATNLIRQLSIFFTFISFITSNILIMRIVLTFSFGIGLIAICVEGSPINLSYMMWNFVILLINIKHVILICYSKRHIKFDDDRELLYNKIFRKIFLRSIYKVLMQNSLIRVINQDRYYAKEGDECNNLTILISGIMKKIDTKNKVSYVKVCSFIDSPEFVMRHNIRGQRFNVSFYAETECKILIWPREMITDLLDSNIDIERSLRSILGIDVANKVFVLDNL